MIETCSKRRMLLAVGIITLISVIVLIIENNYSWHTEVKDVSNIPGNLSKDCWDNSPAEITLECRPCQQLDVKAGIKQCEATGYIETVKCKYRNGSTYEESRSCPMLTWIEERNFWVFETVMGLMGVGSYVIVCIRQKRLDRQLLDKVHKQIAAGV